MTSFGIDKSSVLLISLPWDDLKYPSIQLGVLRAVVEREGIRCEVRSLNLEFMEHAARATSGRTGEAPLSVRDYAEIMRWSLDVSLGDWIFAIPRFLGEDSQNDARYLAFLESLGIPDEDVRRALRFRDVVPSFLEHSATEILAADPACVGFTVAFNQSVASLALAKLLKSRAPSLPIVFGGANCQGPMGSALHAAFPWIDVVVRGEGEPVLPKLVRALVEGREPEPQPGLCLRDRSGRTVVVPEARTTFSIGDSPTPVYDEYFERLEHASFRPDLIGDVKLLYEGSRGCWWGAKSHCTFCGISDLVMPFRQKKPERVVDELTELARKHQRLDFVIVDYILALDHLKEVTPRLRESGYDLRLFCETKANLKREQLRLLRDAGFKSIQAGIESLSTPILRSMAKGVTAFQNVRLIKWCAELDIHLHWNVIYGLPGEPPEEYAQIADTMRSLTHLEPPRLVPLSLDRFSPYFDRAAEYGLEVLGPRADFRFVYPLEDAAIREIVYAFDYRHVDGRVPDRYIGEVRDVVERWTADRPLGFGSLRYRRGPGFLKIRDRRPNLSPCDVSLDEREAVLYLACEDGASAEGATKRVAAAGLDPVSPAEARAFLDDLVAARLMYAENGRYLALALPATPPR